MKTSLANKPKIWAIIFLSLAICVVIVWVSNQYFAQHSGMLESKTIWELESVVLNGQQKLPQEVLRYSHSPRLLFATWRDYLGSDGCNGFNGYYLYGRDGTIKADIYEKTLVACEIILTLDKNSNIIGSEDPSKDPSKLDFLNILKSVSRYEVQPDKLLLYFPEDQSNRLVFHPTDKPIHMTSVRWECHTFPFVARILVSLLKMNCSIASD